MSCCAPIVWCSTPVFTSKHWTRQQMVDFFHAHSSEDEPDVQAETDRYITWPAPGAGV
jgi:uncharacterized protein (DUF885 family)